MIDEDEEAWINSGDDSTFSEWRARPKPAGIIHGTFSTLLVPGRWLYADRKAQQPTTESKPSDFPPYENWAKAHYQYDTYTKDT